MRTKHMNETAKPVAEICLYGNTGYAGAGAFVNSQTVAWFEVAKERTLTDALYLAIDALRRDAVSRSFPAPLNMTERRMVVVYSPDGLRQTVLDLDDTIPTVGEITWSPAPVYTIPVDALVAAAEK